MRLGLSVLAIMLSATLASGAPILVCGLTSGPELFPRLPCQEWVDFYSSALAKASAISLDGKLLIVAGYTNQGTGLDYMAIAYDTSTGRERWSYPYDVSGFDDRAYAVALDPPAKRVFVTGTGSANPSDYATVAFDTTTGAHLWTSRYRVAPGSMNRPYAITTIPDGSQVFVAGLSSIDGFSPHSDIATIAYDATTGYERWVARYAGPNAQANAIAVSPDGKHVYVAGRSGASSCCGGPGAKAVTVAYDAATGQQEWAATYQGTLHGDNSAYALALSPDGSKVVMTGYSSELVATDHGLDALASTYRGWTNDYLTIAYDANSGNPVWTRLYTGTPGTMQGAVDIAANRDGVYVLGSTLIIPGDEFLGSSDYVTIAYDWAGDQRWASAWPGPPLDALPAFNDARKLAVSPSGRVVYATGVGWGADLNQDWSTIGMDAASGKVQWARTFGGLHRNALGLPALDGQTDEPFAMTVAPDGNHLYVSGVTRPGGLAHAATVAYAVEP